MKKTLILFLLLSTLGRSGAQDIRYARWLIDTLSSTAYFGRGYVNDGMANAAVLLAQEMERLALRPAGASYMQSFPIGVNTFPGQLEFRADQTYFIPGLHFVAAPFTPPTQGVFPLVYPDTSSLLDGTFVNDDPSAVIVFPEPGEHKVLRRMLDSLRYRNPYGCAGLVRLKDRISWHVSGSYPPKHYFLIDAVDSLWPGRPDSVGVVVRSIAEPQYLVDNVFGMVRGTRYPERFILFTAHYDHLGMMGPYAIFPGGNDNASGTAMIMDLARHFAENPPEYSVGILACASEEAGLLGSRYFAEHPLIPLDKIRFVVNLDMVGTGSEGIGVVNGKTLPEAFAVLDSINAAEQLIPDVSARGEAANSDHHPFYEKGVPAFFIYTRGKEHREYHNLADRGPKVPLTAYEEVFRLLLHFADGIMKDGR